MFTLSFVAGGGSIAAVLMGSGGGASAFAEPSVDAPRAVGEAELLISAVGTFASFTSSTSSIKSTRGIP
jgi:hypothetical protein